MSLSVSAKKNLFLSPPRAAGIGQVLAVSVSATASYVNLSTLFQPAAGGQSGAQTQGSSGVVVGVLDNYISIYADGAELGVVFGLTAAAVSGANAPALATVGSLSAGAYTPPATPACWGADSAHRDRLDRPIVIGQIGIVIAQSERSDDPLGGGSSGAVRPPAFFGTVPSV